MYASIIENEIRDWHLSQGGHGTRAAGHALRILREVVELCVAAGAQPYELEDALYAEVAKALDRKEFLKTHTSEEVLEEFADVSILMTVFREYFIAPGNEIVEMMRKMGVVRQRQWEADADGVLWRPGTKAGCTPRGPAESS